MKNMTFEQWWKETYEGRISNIPIMEIAFKEIAEKAWEQSRITNSVIKITERDLIK